MFTAENQVGRLIEVRLDGGGTLQDHQALNSKVFALLARMSQPAVFCTDMRKVDAFTDELAARLAQTYRTANLRVARTAIVARPKTRLAEQIEKIVREAGSPARRVFLDPADAQRWLGEILDEAERARLAVFVGVAR